MITGIVVALPEEISTLTSIKIAKGCCVSINDAIILAFSGAGADNARAASGRLLAQGAGRLISWGCAAGLTHSLRPGDLVLPDVLIDAEGTRLPTHTIWHLQVKALLSTCANIHAGSLAESHCIVGSSSDKVSLNAKTGAVAVDMESIAVAKIARQNNLPFIALRTIADPVEMDLPKAVSYALNDQGDVLLSKLLFFLARRPTELPGLIKLGLHFNAAKKTLKLAATQLDQITAFASPNP